MLDAFRKLILALSARGAARDIDRKARKLVILGIKAGDQLPGFLGGMQKLADAYAAEAASWVGPQALAGGLGGRFDTCDLRHWLALAARAGVPAVPAREILSLTEAEMSLVSGKIEVSKVLRSRLAAPWMTCQRAGWCAMSAVARRRLRRSPVWASWAPQRRMCASARIWP
jgi:hypothetical protein